MLVKGGALSINNNIVYTLPYYPVGRIIETTSAEDNPNNLYKGQKWELFGQGKVTVSYDSNDTDFNTVGKVGGEKEHTLTVREMPEHKHEHILWGESNFVYTYTKGGNKRVLDLAGSGVYWRDDCNFATTGKVRTDNAGGDKPHNNLQPYVVVYRWRRIS